MALSARNQLQGRIGKLKKGDKVEVVIESTEVMLMK
jgi:molybdopterin-binding protein